MFLFTLRTHIYSTYTCTHYITFYLFICNNSNVYVYTRTYVFVACGMCVLMCLLTHVRILQIVNGNLKTFLELSAKIGGDVKGHVSKPTYNVRAGRESIVHTLVEVLLYTH